VDQPTVNQVQLTLVPVVVETSLSEMPQQWEVKVDLVL